MVFDQSDLFATIVDFMSIVQLENKKRNPLTGMEKKKKVLTLVEKYLEDHIQDKNRLEHIKFILNMAGGLMIDGIKSIANNNLDLDMLRTKMSSMCSCFPYKKK